MKHITAMAGAAGDKHAQLGATCEDSVRAGNRKTVKSQLYICRNCA